MTTSPPSSPAGPPALTVADARRRFVTLRATRWIPAGLLIPVLVLLVLDRGLALGDIGVVFAVQALIVFLLELPTGGLADSIGRRPVLLLGSTLDAIALLVLVVASSLSLFVVVAVLFGIYRALESGPLEAWYVDTMQAADPEADIDTGLARAGVATGVAIASGALCASAVVAIDPISSVNPLAVPVAIAVVMRIVDIVAIATLMTESRPVGTIGVRGSLMAAPGVIRDARRLITGSRIILCLVAIEFFWGFGATAFETFFPARLAELVDGTDHAASLLGPTVMVAWLISAAGSGVAPRLARRTGRAQAAMLLHLLQIIAVIAMALVGGAFAAMALYLLTMGAHGAINPLYSALLHQQADSAHRATIVSAASMAGHPGYAVSGVLLGAFADHRSVSAAMVVGALVMLGTIPLYRPALEWQRRQRDAGPADSHDLVGELA